MVTKRHHKVTFWAIPFRHTIKVLHIAELLPLAALLFTRQDYLSFVRMISTYRQCWREGDNLLGSVSLTWFLQPHRLQWWPGLLWWSGYRTPSSPYPKKDMSTFEMMSMLGCQSWWNTPLLSLQNSLSNIRYVFANHMVAVLYVPMWGNVWSMLKNCTESSRGTAASYRQISDGYRVLFGLYHLMLNLLFGLSLHCTHPLTLTHIELWLWYTADEEYDLFLAKFDVTLSISLVVLVFEAIIHTVASY